MELSRLYAITDRKLIQSSLGEDIAAAVKGGAGLIQLREKNVTEDEYIAYAREALAVCRSLGARLIINDSVAVCAAAGADGVHLGQGDTDPKEARRILGGNAIIGVTAKTVEQAQRAETDGADYLGSGAVFGTSTKADAVKMDIETLREIVSSVSIPVYAIGGINAENISQLRGSGIYGAAVVSGIFKGDIEKNAARLKEEVELL
ncbi:MAG TPA: thiamine phosphate synthase [Candidatus Ornithomonoglobus merdipullorum]|uniref:Thiamine-phosphate synthase n=1 Tax=Candidatus Ornithomonoglobus merdipullorum TaxID=2840895 RepID=A0A9D1MCG0_9FIRM|nr:thiamine phosphate synthase [Candidatus Ornithomonoglobus merdipullorum]